MGLTRPQAIIRRMDAAGHGLRGAMMSLARMLAIVDYEHDEDMRVFGYSRDPPPACVNLREAARGAVEEAGAPTPPAGNNRPNSRSGTPLAARWPTPATVTATIIAFKSFGGEPTATFPNRACAGRVPCFSSRDGHFDARVTDIDRWPNADPTRHLLTELADNFWPD